MMRIKKEITDKIIEHARKELPNEACGYLVGEDDVILWSYEMTNVDKSPEHFSFSPEEQFKLYRKVRNLGQTIYANYHSHPSTPSRPSEEDIRLAHDPDISYVIVSLAEEEPVVKSFRIKNGESNPEEVIIIK